MLEILALTYNDLPPVMPVSGKISREGGTVGRGSDNAVILPDPMKAVSRIHLDFTPHSGNTFLLSNISSGNPVFINNQQLDSGQKQVIQDGDKIMLGGYVLEARYVNENETEGPAAPNAAADVLPQPEPDFFAKLMSEAASAAPAPELNDGNNPFAREPRLSLDPMQALFDQGIGLESFVGKDDGLINGDNVDAATSELFRDPLAEVADSGLLANLDENSLDPLAFFDGDDGGGDVLSDDLDRFFVGLGSVAPPVQPSVPPPPPPATKHVEPPPPVLKQEVHVKDEDIGEAMPTEPISPKAAPQKPSSPVQAKAAPPRKAKRTKANDADATVSSADEEELYAAFIEGLGIALPHRNALDPNLMRLIGQLLRSYSQGMVDLISSRAVIKQEVRANVTLIAPERNNPLKFSPDANVALLHMLGQQFPGFLEPVESVQQAFIDLRAHQIGIVTGMQSALNHVLDRFNPDVIGDEPSQKLFDKLFVAGRKAKLWDKYGHYYHKTRDSAADHFQSFFGAAFLAAYEKAIAEQTDDGDKS